MTGCGAPPGPPEARARAIAITAATIRPRAAPRLPKPPMTVPDLLPLPWPATRRALRAAPAALALVFALAGCGGGTSTLDPFEPTRVLAFGDELSLINKAGGAAKVGSKYTINALDSADTTNQTLACDALPVWPQVVAQTWGIAFEECNPGIEATPRGRMFATAGANVASVAAALDAFRASQRLTRGDLFTVSAGMHDVLAAYRQIDSSGGGFTEANAQAQVRAAARELARAIDAVADANGRLVFITVPDLSLSPYARAEEAAKGGARMDLIDRLVAGFNTELRLNVQNNGRRLGLVKADEIMQGIVGDIAEGLATITNVSDAACDAAKYNPGNDPAVDLSACTTATLTEAASGKASTYMWADATRVSASIHGLLGAVAFSISRTNPF